MAGTGVLSLAQPRRVFSEPLSRPDLNTWVADGDVFAIANTDEVTYIGGNFTYVGPNTGGGALISAATGRPLPPYLRVNGKVHTVATDEDGRWYIGGEFTSVGGVPRNNLARIHPSGALDRSWDFNVDNRVYALEVDGPYLYVGGGFTAINGIARYGIARIVTEHRILSTWNPGVQGTVYAIEVGNGVIYLGGSFNVVAGYTRWFLAAVDIDPGEATSWNPSVNDNVGSIEVRRNSLCGRPFHLRGRIGYCMHLWCAEK